ncbi:type II toxin-antitoxin system VapB family antitoxin [Achromobacter ruhlandii]|uniref:type II toxin-antitoxin system VapB family antitoxin n=1 Tax=Achromobacter ruhlandii TaxID=72557 RepID=UPI003B9A0D37
MIESKSSSFDANFCSSHCKEACVRTTVTLDDDLLELARTYTGVQETSALVTRALTQLVQKEAAKRLAKLGGSSPKLKPIPRRQTECNDPG